MGYDSWQDEASYDRYSKAREKGDRDAIVYLTVTYRIEMKVNINDSDEEIYEQACEKALKSPEFNEDYFTIDGFQSWEAI